MKQSIVPAVEKQSITLQDALRLSGEARGKSKVAIARRYDQRDLVQFVSQAEPNKVMQETEFGDEDGYPLFRLRDITLDELSATDWLPIVDDEQAVA